MSNLVFGEATWTDDQDGGSVGYLHGRKMTLESHGTLDTPMWTIVLDNDQYGFQRGNRGSERTLADIKKIAIESCKYRIESRYQSALSIIEWTERNCKG